MEARGQETEELNESYTEASEEDFDFSCDPCSTDGPQLPAAGFCVDCQNYLCETCYKYHCRPLPTRNHVLLDKHVMPQQKNPKLAKDMLTEKCPQHEEKSTKYYCRSHDQLGCSVCMTIGHKSCDGVDYIADISKGIEDSTDYKDFLKKLTNIEGEFTNNSSKTKENISQSEACYSGAVDDIRKLRKEINNMFDRLENEIVKEAKDIQDEDIDKMNSISAACEVALQEIQTLNSDLEMLIKSKKNQKLFIQMNKGQKDMRRLEDASAKMETENMTRQYTFVPEGQINTILSNLKVFGQLKLKKYLVINQARDINVKLNTDQWGTCWVTGSTILSDGRLAVTDYQNNTVKLININQNWITAHLTLANGPWDITETNKGEVAVTLVNKKAIQFLTVKDTLSAGREMQVDGKCRGIARWRDRLAVTFISPPKVEIMEMNGTVLKLISTIPSGVQLFKSPENITISPDQSTLYVSDKGNHSVTSLNMDSEVWAVYRDKDLKSPAGICSDIKGNVYICGHSSNNVHQTTAKFDNVQILHNKCGALNGPCSVTCSEKGDQLYIGTQDNNNMKVFQLII